MFNNLKTGGLGQMAVIWLLKVNMKWDLSFSNLKPKSLNLYFLFNFYKKRFY